MSDKVCVRVGYNDASRERHARETHTGELQLVPPTDCTVPSSTIWNPSACAATSGYARPVALDNERFDEHPHCKVNNSLVLTVEFVSKRLEILCNSGGLV
jgi:hypothetical protein